jgi:hypothetical protein
MTFETSKQFTENELFTISLGASFFKTVDRDMLKHGPRALVFGMDPKRNPGQHVFFYYHQAIGYLRHYLKVLGVHQIGAELGYDFYSRAVELAEMDEKNKRIIEINPWIKSNHLAAKYATNPLDIEHQLQVSIDALEHMTKNTPHFDIYSQMSFPMKNVLSDFYRYSARKNCKNIVRTVSRFRCRKGFRY